MPVIVVGADTASGRAIVEGLHHPDREIRAFVSDETVGSSLKERGVKVALGDVSDESHVEAAATRCFSAVLVAEAASDARERSFASSATEVLAGWSRAVSNSAVRRVIWVGSAEPPDTEVEEVARVSPSDPDYVEKVIELDEAQSIGATPDT